MLEDGNDTPRLATPHLGGHNETRLGYRIKLASRRAVSAVRLRDDRLVGAANS
jgi:hypothetical protein